MNILANQMFEYVWRCIPVALLDVLPGAEGFADALQTSNVPDAKPAHDQPHALVVQLGQPAPGFCLALQVVRARAHLSRDVGTRHCGPI
jgi:hypothetical protein